MLQHSNTSVHWYGLSSIKCTLLNQATGDSVQGRQIWGLKLPLNHFGGGLATPGVSMMHMHPLPPLPSAAWWKVGSWGGLAGSHTSCPLPPFVCALPQVTPPLASFCGRSQAPAKGKGWLARKPALAGSPLGSIHKRL